MKPKQSLPRKTKKSVSLVKNKTDDFTYIIPKIEHPMAGPDPMIYNGKKIKTKTHIIEMGNLLFPAK